MKYICNGRRDNTRAVAPLVGAWIEMIVTPLSAPLAFVAPLVGAWIEIQEIKELGKELRVAPLVGAWIEIQIRELFKFR